MQRYFVEGPVPEDRIVTVAGEDARHIVRVMRGQSGDSLILVIGGTAFQAELKETEPAVLVKVKEPLAGDPELPKQVTIACGLPKGDKLDLIAQKATELGMHALLPFQAERSVVKWDAAKGGKKTARLQKIAKEAAEQSHRTAVPLIHTIHSFDELLRAASGYDALIAAYEEEARSESRTRFADTVKTLYDKDSILIVFGPEGGFSDAEISRLREAGALFTSLGPRILRAETAPLYALAAMSYEYE